MWATWWLCFWSYPVRIVIPYIVFKIKEVFIRKMWSSEIKNVVQTAFFLLIILGQLRRIEI